LSTMVSSVWNDVLLDIDEDGVATVTLNRPEHRNALSARLLQEFREVIRLCEQRDDVKCIVLTGAGKAFCAGIDLREFARGKPGGVDPRAQHGDPKADRSRGFLHGVTKLVIGAINGPAVTGGLELALVCDFLIASTAASFADTHARVGIMPGGGMTVVLPHWIGIPRARQMSVTGDYIGAQQALAWGLVNEIVEPEQLLPRARQLARTAAKMELRAVRHVLATYAATTGGVPQDGWATEKKFKREFAESDSKEVGLRYDNIRLRGAAQNKAKL